MGSGQGVIQAELSIELGQFLAALNQAHAALAKYAQSAGSSMGSANQAMDGASKSAKNLGEKIASWKGEQTGQARTVNFIVKELTDVTGLSKEAASAVGGLGQVMMEAAAGGGAFAVGFEAVKFVVTQAVAEWKRAGEELKALAAIQTIATSAVMEGKYALDKLTAAKGTEGDKAFRETFDAATKGAKDLTEEVEKMREKGPGVVAWVRAAFGDGTGLQRFEDTLASAAANLDRVVASAKEYAGYARDVAGGWEESPEQGAAYWKIKADDFKANVAAANAASQGLANLRGEEVGLAEKHAQAVAKINENAQVELGTRQQMLLVEQREYELALALSKIKRMPRAEEFSGFEDGARLDPDGALQQLADQAGRDRDAARIREDQAVNGRLAESYDAGTFDLTGISASQVELERLNKSASASRAAFSELGAGIGSAFSSIGSAIGGAAGEFISQVGAMIAQTVALVLALAFSDTLMTGPLGVFAAVPMAAGILASLVAMIASVPSFDVGTLSVPRTGLAMVHAGEAILPVGGPAETYRAGLARSGSRSGGRSDGTTVNVSLNVTALDGPSVYRTLNGNRGELARVIREAMRDGVM